MDEHPAPVFCRCVPSGLAFVWMTPGLSSWPFDCPEHLEVVGGGAPRAIDALSRQDVAHRCVTSVRSVTRYPPRDADASPNLAGESALSPEPRAGTRRFPMRSSQRQCVPQDLRPVSLRRGRGSHYPAAVANPMTWGLKRPDRRSAMAFGTSTANQPDRSHRSRLRTAAPQIPNSHLLSRRRDEGLPVRRALAWGSVFSRTDQSSRTKPKAGPWTPVSGAHPPRAACRRT